MRFASTLLCLAVLTGCGGSALEDITPESVSQERLSDEERYVNALRDIGPSYLKVGTDEELIEMGRVVCDSIDAGGVEETLYLMYDASGGKAETLDGFAAIGATAVDTLCPEHSAEMDAVLRELTN